MTGHSAIVQDFCGKCGGWRPGVASIVKDTYHTDIKDCTCSPANREQVDHPPHYGGGDNPYEVIKVITAWGLGFNLGNCVKYIARAGKKDKSRLLEDLRKARWYIDYEIKHLEEHA